MNESADGCRGPERTFWLGLTSLLLALAGIGCVLSLVVIAYGHRVLHQLAKASAPRQGRGVTVAGLLAAYAGLILGGSLLGFAAVHRGEYMATITDQGSRHRLTPATAADVKALTSDQKRWILATSALIIQVNRERHDLLGGREKTSRNAAEARDRLQDGWSVTNRASLLSTLAWLEQEGHRREFEDMGRAIAHMDAAKLEALKREMAGNAEMINRVNVVRENYVSLGEKSLCGWDYARYVALCRWGWLAGYLQEEESWQFMLPAAREMQAVFESWNDLGHNYLIGRWFWSLRQTHHVGRLYGDAFDELLQNPSSPWRQLPWELNLK